MFVFLKQNYDALDKQSSIVIIIFYTDCSNTFDNVSLSDFSKELSQVDVGGCTLEVICDYLNQRKQFVRLHNTSSQLLDVTSDVPQDSVLGPLMFCTFIYYLPASLKSNDP